MARVVREPLSLISLEAAWKAIGAEVRPGGRERISLSAARGRILAEAVTAASDQPAFDKAMMDGFALRAADVTGAGHGSVELRIAGEVLAGRTASRPLAPGEAMRINTGAPLPEGADAVVPVEKTQLLGDRVRIPAGVAEGHCVARQGSDARSGDEVLRPPLCLGAAQLAAAATVGAASMVVYQRPRVAIVVTGDELVAPGAVRQAGQIYDTNGPALAALAEECGATSVSIGIACDAVGPLREALSAALREPVVVSVGGMSMGSVDLVPQVSVELGVRWRFHGVSLRPGKPTGYGVGPAGQHVFGLPGNPVSAFVCFHLFVRPVLDGLQGMPARPRPLVRARVAASVRGSRESRPALIPAAVCTSADGELEVRAVEWHGSADAFGLARANCLLSQPRGHEPLNAGEWANVLPLNPWWP